MPQDPQDQAERVRVLEISHQLLTDQVAELVVGMREMRAAAESKLGALEAELAANSEVTAEVRDMLQIGRAGLKVLGGLGTAARWVGYLSAAAASVYALAYTITHGGKPPGG